jgi:hypothetical protein
MLNLKKGVRAKTLPKVSSHARKHVIRKEDIAQDFFMQIF